MKSPITAKEMKLVYDRRTWNFRNEEYEYIHASWLCEDSGESFTTDELDDAAYLQVTNKYRERYGIPYTDEIIALRERYGLSASKMSLFLGIGANQWRLYESGEVPSVSNGRMIRSISDAGVFLDLVKSCRHLLSEREYKKICMELELMASRQFTSREEGYDMKRVFAVGRGFDNGFAPQSLSRLKNVLLYILSRCGEQFCTKMNKMLFYADYLAYRRMSCAISGLSYRAIAYGPVPERWDRIYSQFNDVVMEPRNLGDFEGVVLVPKADPDMSMFSEREISVLNDVCERFWGSSSREMSELSHEELAWIDSYKDQRRISFDYAFDLKAI